MPGGYVGFSGYLGRPLFYNRALSPTEVAQLYTNGGVPAGVDLPALKGASAAGATATSGTLVIGVRYRLTDWITTDDFTNVGAASNADGVEFVATGTTPTTWTNSSIVTTLGLLCYPEANPPGSGSIWRDVSGNNANLTWTTGVSWAQPSSTTYPAINLTSGANLNAGTFALTAGSATVSNTGITANSVVVASLKTSGGTPGIYAPLITLTPSTGFTATGLATDTSTYNYVVFGVK
jgi:hypothetical protein